MNCDPTIQEQIAFSIAGNAVQSGEDMMADAIKWCEEHPDAWQDVLDRATEAAESGRRCSVRLLIDNMCWDRHIGVKHALTAPLARILVEQVPGFDLCIRTARSKVDQCRAS